MAKTVDISTLKSGDLCFLDGGKIAKVIAHINQHIPRQGKTMFEDENGHVDLVWSEYKVTID